MFASFKELISSAASTSAQRVKNPVLGAFALSWCAFNWKQILYLLFSDDKIIVRINYISDVSNWWVSFLYPAASTAAICIFLPLINLLIAWLQIIPLDLSDNIEHKKYMAKTDRRKQKRKADAELDVIYEQTKTGAEKEIQAMKEEITDSKDRAGILTKELDDKNSELLELKGTMAELDTLLKEKENYSNLLSSELKETLLELNKYRSNFDSVVGSESFKFGSLYGEEKNNPRIGDAIIKTMNKKFGKND